jgi:hypothetical protein
MPIDYSISGGDILQIIEIVFISIVFALSVFIMIGSYVMQRQKYWNRVWERLGRPKVGSIKELKALSEKQNKASATR